MSPKPLRAGGEVDSWCTKCRMWLNHRIVAMVGTTPRKVECSTCGSHHLYRAHPPGEREAAPARGARGAPSTTRSPSGAPRAPRMSSVTKAEVARLEREKTWEKATVGKAVAEFKRYDVAGTFREGDLVKHTKFGDGIVTRVLDARKVEVMFRDETRTLAQGLTGP
jgi:hypothetical protein